MARILIDFFTPTPDTLTGISVYSFRLARALAEHGRHEYVLSTNWSRDALPPDVAAAPFAAIVHRASPANEARAMLRATRDLPRIRREHGCDRILFTQPTTMLRGMGRAAVVIHDLYRVTNADLYRLRQRMQWRWMVAQGFNRASALIAVSAATRDALIAAYPRCAGRTAVVHEAPILAPGDAAPHREGVPYALVVANMTRNKNVGALVAALGLLAARGIRPRVLVVGRDEVGALAAAVAQAGPIDLVPLGSVGEDRLRALYAGAHAYINTSLVEGFCLPIVEAHQFGVPVICSDLAVLREVAGDGALFVDPTRPDRIADAIAALFADPALHARLTAAARRNRDRFSWEKAAEQTERVLDTLAPLDADMGGSAT